MSFPDFCFGDVMWSIGKAVVQKREEDTLSYHIARTTLRMETPLWERGEFGDAFGTAMDGGESWRDFTDEKQVDEDAERFHEIMDYRHEFGGDDEYNSEEEDGGGGMFEPGVRGPISWFWVEFGDWDTGCEWKNRRAIWADSHCIHFLYRHGTEYHHRPCILPHRHPQEPYRHPLE